MTLAHAEPGADAADGIVDTVRLSDGRALTIRPVTKADIAGLVALFEGVAAVPASARSSVTPARRAAKTRSAGEFSWSGRVTGSGSGCRWRGHGRIVKVRLQSRAGGACRPRVMLADPARKVVPVAYVGQALPRPRTQQPDHGERPDRFEGLRS